MSASENTPSLLPYCDANHELLQCSHRHLPRESHEDRHRHQPWCALRPQQTGGLRRVWAQHQQPYGPTKSSGLGLQVYHARPSLSYLPCSKQVGPQQRWLGVPACFQGPLHESLRRQQPQSSSVLPPQRHALQPCTAQDRPGTAPLPLRTSS